jgi:asparagine synthase (glutamine-hydrolysing)
MLALPAHQLYNGGDSKLVLRNAMRGLLPEAVRTRAEPPDLGPLYRRGVAEKEAKLVRDLITAPDALWRAYVREDWLLDRLPESSNGHSDPIEDLAVWRCVVGELWWRRRQGLALPKAASVRGALASRPV